MVERDGQDELWEEAMPQAGAHAQSHRARLAAGDQLGFPHDLLGFRDHLAGSLGDHFADPREMRPGRRPLEQLDLELIFQTRDGGRQAGLGHAERLGCLRKAPAPANGEELAHVAHVHGETAIAPDYGPAMTIRIPSLGERDYPA